VATGPKAEFRRRVQFTWSSAPAKVEPGADIPLERAHKTLVSAVGPPYRKVEDLIPRPADATGSVIVNVELEDWHWGTMPSNLVARLDQWTQVHIGPQQVGLLVGMPGDSVGMGLTVHPQAIVKLIVDDLQPSTAFCRRPSDRPVEINERTSDRRAQGPAMVDPTACRCSRPPSTVPHGPDAASHSGQ
jgi:hypothetical protein